MSTSASLRSTQHDEVLLVTFDVEGSAVNTLTPEVAAELEAVLTRSASDPSVRALVFASGKKDFSAGTRIEFLATLTTASEGAAASRLAQAALERLDAFPKPVVVAVDGACLGTGLEWALACDYRIASDSPQTSLGVPEVRLGLIPSGGGTQRLPRLIGVQSALDLILTGRRVRAKRALKLGLVDEVVPQPLLVEVAKRRARELASGELKVDRSRGLTTAVARGKGLADIVRGLADQRAWAELALEDNPLGRRLLFEQARRTLLTKTRGKYPAPERALEVVRVGLERDFKAGLEAEATAFGELVVSDVSRRLAEIFQATTALKKETGAQGPTTKPREVRKLGVVGGGLMGSGIAFVASAHQLEVRIKDRDAAGVRRALAQVHRLYDERVRKKSMTWREREARCALVTATSDASGFRQCDVVIEAVFEDLALKHQVLKEVEAACRPELIFASNTSSLPITSIAEPAAHPENVIGMHYFSPVHKMPLLEVVRHRRTSDQVTATCVALGKRQGKTVIVVNDAVGFYSSRILSPYLNEAAHLLAEGADIAELDRALVDFGFPVGPVTLLDEVGIDVAATVGKIMNRAYGERMPAAPAAEVLVADGRLGRKAGRGFYLYADGHKRGVDTSVYALLPHGKERTRFDRQEMAERCVLRLVNEAVRALEEGVLRCPRDGDIGAIFGLGFPPFLGGPFRYIDSVGLGRTLQRTEHYQERFGRRFDPAPLLAERLKSGRKLS